MGWLKRLILCGILGDHTWTCAAEEGQKPTKAQARAGVAGFYDYARMYCKRCGYTSRLSM